LLLKFLILTAKLLDEGGEFVLSIEVRSNLLLQGYISLSKVVVSYQQRIDRPPSRERSDVLLHFQEGCHSLGEAPPVQVEICSPLQLGGWRHGVRGQVSLEEGGGIQVLEFSLKLDVVRFGIRQLLLEAVLQRFLLLELLLNDTVRLLKRLLLRAMKRVLRLQRLNPRLGLLVLLKSTRVGSLQLTPNLAILLLELGSIDFNGASLLLLGVGEAALEFLKVAPELVDGFLLFGIRSSRCWLEISSYALIISGDNWLHPLLSKFFVLFGGFIHLRFGGCQDTQHLFRL